MRRIVTAVATIALMAGAGHAQGQGQGKGNDRGGGDKPAAAGQQGGGGDRGQGNGKADRGNGNQAANGPSMAQAARAPDRGPENRGQGNAKRDESGGGNNGNADRGNPRAAERAVERASKDDRGRGNDNRTVAIDRRDNDRGVEFRRAGDFARLAPRGLIEGCPPGLAKKNPPCVPPGQVRGNDRDMFRWDRPDFWGLRGLTDGRYFYDDGYLVRYAPSGGILGYVPLLGGALGVGNAWPDYYEPFAMPSYYERYYGLGQHDSYRYADDVIYRVDPQTDAITSIAALLTGDQFGIGQAMPRGYDVYNVPWEYRDQYRDGPDSHYRYADGHVYQVDPKTQLIAAAIELLAS